MSATDAAANSILDAILGGSTSVIGATAYIGLLLAAPAANGSGVSEPAGGSYARVGVTNNLTQWPAASARTKTHSADIIFPTATGNWGTILYVGVFDAASAGNLKLYQPIDVARTVFTGDIFRFLTASSPLKFIL